MKTQRKLQTAIISAGIAGMLTAGVFAAGSVTKGKFYMKKSCKPCHAAKTSEGGLVTPVTKTQAQWKEYFKENKHNKGTQKLTDVLSADKLEHVEAFCVAHASDSPQPETCGG